MTKPSRKRRSVYRVFANDQGRVYLELEPDGIRIPIERPITAEKLAGAKSSAINLRIEREDAEAADKLPTIDPNRAEAQKEIEAALHPILKGPWLTKLKHIGRYIGFRLFAFFVYVFTFAGPYRFIRYSSQHSPDWLHAIVLTVYLIILAALIFLIGTERNRSRFRKRVLAWFGVYGMVVLPCLIIVTSAAVLASITFRLYNRGLITLETCAGRAVSEDRLLDFYLWHFVNIIPTLQITKLWRWGEPYCYSQIRVGLLIFVFQLLVVIPSFNSIRYYWKRRHQRGYSYDPNWNPELL